LAKKEKASKKLGRTRELKEKEGIKRVEVPNLLSEDAAKKMRNQRGLFLLCPKVSDVVGIMNIGGKNQGEEKITGPRTSKKIQSSSSNKKIKPVLG